MGPFHVLTKHYELLTERASRKGTIAHWLMHMLYYTLIAPDVMPIYQKA